MNNNKTIAAVQRDVRRSAFGKILATLEEGCDGFIAAIFYDELGETIDYHSYLDPFDTRLAGAHHGLFMSSINGRSKWIGIGQVNYIEILASERESLTVLVGEELFLTVLVKIGALNATLHKRVNDIIDILCDEIGV